MTRLIAISSLAILGNFFPLGSMAVAQGGSAQGSSAVELAIIQLEKDWVQAALKKDAGAMDRIIADDWVGIAFNGTTLTKADVLNDLKSGATASQTIELGPLKVRVYGDTAIVNGSSTEKSTWQGKDSSGHYVLVDVFVNRKGRWQVVSSQVTKDELNPPKEDDTRVQEP
jgi:ketosteroid isomerase-like protein